MEETIEKTEFKQLAIQLKLKESVIAKVIELIEEGNTVPFIARYRKEVTGGLDEVEIKTIVDTWTYAVNLNERKKEVIRLIAEQDKLTDELEATIQKATKLQRIEDLYRPFRQKRRTRATIAKEKGLEPLALKVWEQSEVFSLEEEAQAYFTEEHEIATVEDVQAGVNDILAEWISDDPAFREWIRTETFERGRITAAVKKDAPDEKGVFKNYYEYEERIKTIVEHRVLALNRGEKENVLRIGVDAPVENIENYLVREIIRRDLIDNPNKEVIITAIEDGYKRLIAPSIEREIRNGLTEKAEIQAIEVFSVNLRNLLLQPPLRGNVILAIDPAFRTGCKLCLVDETGKMLGVDVIYPTLPRNNNDIPNAKKKILSMLKEQDVGLIAIGNGTASRETEQFVAELIQEHDLKVPYIIVNEAGASVYSASEMAREEFPDLQVEERSAVSIARRVQDPLAELVKIDPKSIGVGQYQYDVSQKELSDSLTFVVETAVNQVGVNVNTASGALLQYVSGLSKAVANNIVKQRNELGKFKNRKELKKVPRLGAKTYEQGIGFLRIIDGEHPLDRTPIHPESYKQTEQLLRTLDSGFEDIGTEELRDKLSELDRTIVAEELDIGKLTLEDIITALVRPERDLRDDFPTPILKKNVLEMEDLERGMEMEGTVRNVVDFGVFVDIGVKEDGLVHISKMAKRFIKHPMDIAAVGDVVTVWVEDIDIEKGRISLSMIKE